MAFSAIAICLPLLVILGFLQANVLCLTGTWKVLIEDAGISSMHTVVTRYGTVVLLDRKVNLSGRPCYDGVSNSGHCISQSKEYHPDSNSLRPLLGLSTDTWCSSGQVRPDGTIVQTGGYKDGGQKVRYFSPCTASAGGHQRCQWIESKESLLKNTRWYSTNQMLPDGTQILVGGLAGANFEYFPPRRDTDKPTNLSLLDKSLVVEDRDKSFYPFLHLLPDGSLFILAGRNSILLDLATNKPKKSLPPIPGVSRTYPAGGSSIMLPLLATESYNKATILVCGGSTTGAFWAPNGINLPATHTCGKITITDHDPSWEIEDMPFDRTMGDMVMLPTHDVLIINGAMRGSQGYGNASYPIRYPVIYKPSKPIGRRFEVQNPSEVPRMYHSTANLLPDGRVFIAGSNTYPTYVFNGSFPSELRLEAFSPDYLDSTYDKMRVSILRIGERVGYRGLFNVVISSAKFGELEVNLMSAPFTTHSFSQGQRLVSVNIVRKYKNSGNVILKCQAPPRAEVAPPGYYMVFVVNGGIPSSSAYWIQIVT